MRPTRHLAILLAGVSLTLGAAACGSDSNEGGPEQDAGGTIVPETGEDVGAGSGNLSVPLRELEGSGQSGSATITGEEGTRIRVVVQMEGSTDTPQPAHVHEGTCENLNPQPKYPLENVEEGRSETVVDGVGIDDLQDGDFSINVHKSEEEADVYVACGEIGSAG